MQHVVKKFLGLAHKFSLPVFVVDKVSLSLLSQDAVLLKDSKLKDPHCTFLCTHRDFITFGLLGNLWKYDVSVLAVRRNHCALDGASKLQCGQPHADYSNGHITDVTMNFQL